MNGTDLYLTEHQQWAVTIGLELEQMGWLAAANALRQKHFPYLPWNDPRVRAVTHKGWEALFHLHHGSMPPYTPAPSRPPVASLPSAIPSKS